MWVWVTPLIFKDQCDIIQKLQRFHILQKSVNLCLEIVFEHTVYWTGYGVAASVIFLPIRQKFLKSLQNGAKISIITYIEYEIDIKVRKGVINP